MFPLLNNPSKRAVRLVRAIKQTGNPVDELAVLQQTNVELLAKLHDSAARITDLEAQLAASQGTAQTAQASLHTL